MSRKPSAEHRVARRRSPARRCAHTFIRHCPSQPRRLPSVHCPPRRAAPRKPLAAVTVSHTSAGCALCKLAARRKGKRAWKAPGAPEFVPCARGCEVRSVLAYGWAAFLFKKNVTGQLTSETGWLLGLCIRLMRCSGRQAAAPRHSKRMRVSSTLSGTLAGRLCVWRAPTLSALVRP